MTQHNRSDRFTWKSGDLVRVAGEEQTSGGRRRGEPPCDPRELSSAGTGPLVSENKGRVSLLDTFSVAIFAKVQAYRDPSLSGAQKRRVAEAIDDDIKKYTTFTPHRVSRAAEIEAREIDPALDLHRMNWHDQPKFDRGRKRFLVEHKRPVSMLRQQCLQATSDDEVSIILDKDLIAVWVVRREDDALRRNGQRSARPDPDEAYRRAQIVLIDKQCVADEVER